MTGIWIRIRVKLVLWLVRSGEREAGGGLWEQYRTSASGAHSDGVIVEYICRIYGNRVALAAVRPDAGEGRRRQNNGENSTWQLARDVGLSAVFVPHLAAFIVYFVCVLSGMCVHAVLLLVFGGVYRGQKTGVETAVGRGGPCWIWWRFCFCTFLCLMQ